MENPLVSIIIPTYNRANLIGETLDSILAQTYTNWECIIVDDGSTDNTDAVVGAYVQKDARFKYYHRPDTHLPGGNGARNYGFLQSQGEYINWFDSDDLMHPEKLEKQVDALHNTDFNFAVCQTLVFEGSKDNILGLRHEKIVSEKPLEDFIMHKIAFLTQAPFFKRPFLEKHQLLFDEELKAAQEWEFICRVLYFSPVYRVDETPMVFIRKHEGGMSYTKDKDFLNWNYYLAREKTFAFLIMNKFLDSELNTYFREYFSNVFLSYVQKKHRKESLIILDKSLKLFFGLSDVILIKILLYLYFLSNRGYLILKKRVLK